MTSCEMPISPKAIEPSSVCQTPLMPIEFRVFVAKSATLGDSNTGSRRPRNMKSEEVSEFGNIVGNIRNPVTVLQQKNFTSTSTSTSSSSLCCREKNGSRTTTNRQPENSFVSGFQSQPHRLLLQPDSRIGQLREHMAVLTGIPPIAQLWQPTTGREDEQNEARGSDSADFCSLTEYGQQRLRSHSIRDIDSDGNISSNKPSSLNSPICLEALLIELNCLPSLLPSPSLHLSSACHDSPVSSFTSVSQTTIAEKPKPPASGHPNSFNSTYLPGQTDELYSSNNVVSPAVSASFAACSSRTSYSLRALPETGAQLADKSKSASDQSRTLSELGLQPGQLISLLVR
ncbi:unnamed protein product [Protopolystoma xenopodis]|uniref:Uncharacterized protein n=1 Tax=Protopolystoma xenopodis TaxID=117903 RepID=A0A448WRG5_9PLAT|nr:unnamed protein product [Protopolystoma xenopodis]